MERFDESRPEFQSYGFTCVLWMPTRMPRPDRHNEIEINLLRSGSLAYLLGGRRVTIPPQRLAVFWAAIPHQIVGFEGVEPYFVVTVPLSSFLSAGLDLRLVDRVLGGEVVLESAPDDCDDVKFRQWEQELREDGSGSEQAVRLEVQARLLRFAQRAGRRRTSRYPEPALSRADELACYIARNYAEPLTSEQIAAANGMHPNYAMSLFRRAFGTTMSTFITQHRISHAQRLLVTTDDSILSIGFGAGFQSLSRFNAAFKAVCGCSPREYRREHRGVDGAGRPVNPAS